MTDTHTTPTTDTTAEANFIWRTGPDGPFHMINGHGHPVPAGRRHPVRENYVVNPYLLKIREMPEWLIEGERLVAMKGQWHTLFGRQAPLWLEIGSCKGEYVAELSQRRPDVNFLGLEIKYKRTWRLGKLAKRLGLTNVRFAEAEGQTLTSFLAPGEIERVIVNFPDPWEKKREWKHRLFQAHFLDTLHGLLAPGGEIWFKTDHEGYYDWTLDLFSADDRYAITFATRDLHHSEQAETNIVTWFEALFTSQGLPTYGLQAVKR
jgi:tRNA (guanine-N7-)-methyltransferase